MLNPTWYPGSGQLRRFALFSPIGFGLIGYLVWHATGSVWWASLPWTIGGMVFLTGMAFPEAARPVYVLMMAISFPIGWVISHIMLRILFYGFFTPLGLFFKIVRRDSLNLNRPQEPTFWREYPKPRDVSSYFRQS